MRTRIIRYVFRAGLALFLLVTGGCLKQKVVVRVRQDGSGTVVVTKVFPENVVAACREHLSAMAKDAETDPILGKAVPKYISENPFYNEFLLRTEAVYFGPDVKLVKSREHSVGGSRGSVAEYSFPDINGVRVLLAYLGPGYANVLVGSSVAWNKTKTAQDEKAFADKILNELTYFNDGEYRFRFVKGIPAVLQVIVPEYDPASDDLELKKSDEPGEEPAELTEREAKERLKLTLRMGLELEFEGEILHSNATHPSPEDKNRLILLDMDLERIAQNFRTLDDCGIFTFRDKPVVIYGEVRNLPGMILETKTNLVISFRPAL